MTIRIGTSGWLYPEWRGSYYPRGLVHRLELEYLASRKVMTLGTDSPSMGPIPDLAEPTHIAGLKHGMIWTEGAIGLGQLPATGAFYCALPPKHAAGAYAEGLLHVKVEGLAEHSGRSYVHERQRRTMPATVMRSSL